MGIFDSLVDLVVEAPGKIIESTTEAVTRIPEVGVRAIKGAMDGVEKGVEKVEKSFDD